MAATTEDRVTTREEGGMVGHTLKVGEEIPQGVLVEIDEDGFAVNAVDGATNTFGGVSVAASKAGEKLQVWRKGIFHFAASGLAEENVNDELYTADNQTVTLTPGNVKVGRLAYFKSATVAPVAIEGAFAKETVIP